MAKRCKSYTGLSCIDGTCPRANREEYEERCMDVPKSCRDCWRYKGCEDCYLAGTEHCEKAEVKEGGADGTER